MRSLEQDAARLAAMPIEAMDMFERGEAVLLALIQRDDSGRDDTAPLTLLALEFLDLEEDESAAIKLIHLIRHDEELSIRLLRKLRGEGVAQ